MSFATTIPVAIKVAGMLADGYKYIKDHPEEIQQAMDEAAKAAAAAKKLAGDAADFLDVDEHMAKAKLLAADAAAILTSDRSEDPEVKKAREEARKAEAEAAKALTEARQAILESADLRTTIPKLVDKLASADDEALALYMNTLDEPGCYVITTYDKIDLDKDLTDYHGVYVGKAEVIGDGIAWAISRAGCPDVYADIKYKQNVVIYVFTCTDEELEYRHQALVETFGALNSYNMPLKKA